MTDTDEDDTEVTETDSAAANADRDTEGEKTDRTSHANAEDIDYDETERDDRTLGVEFGELSEELEDHEYPTTVDDLVEEYGAHELKLPGGEERFDKILEPYTEESGQEFSDVGEVRQAVLNMVGSDAVGQSGYSDRGIEDDERTESF